MELIENRPLIRNFCISNSRQQIELRNRKSTFFDFDSKIWLLAGEDSDISVLQPPVVLVGTHAATLNQERDKRLNMVSEKFQRIRDSLKGKTFAAHVLQMYFSLELVDQR